MSTTYFPTKAVVAQTSAGKTTSNSLYIRDNSQWYPIISVACPAAHVRIFFGNKLIGLSCLTRLQKKMWIHSSNDQT